MKRRTLFYGKTGKTDTGAEVVAHTRGGARLSEQYNPKTAMGKKTLLALENENWDYVVIQGMSKGPVVSEKAFRCNVGRLCELAKEAGVKPVLYATWAYEKDSALAAKAIADAIRGGNR